MIWLNSVAWLGLAAVAVPIAVHLLAHHRAKRLPFPTLRFLPTTRLAAVRRRALEDIALMLVRAAIVTAAVAACAGPLIVTPARRARWDARLARAVVRTPEAPDTAGAPDSAARAFLEQTFRSSDVVAGIKQAVAWLDSAPPARRELLIAAPLTLGSITAADLSAIPTDVGIRFTRVGDLPTTRTIEAPEVLASSGILQRRVTIEGPNTVVRDERGDGRGELPFEIVAPPALAATADAAKTAVLALRVPVPPPDRRVTLILLDGSDFRAVPNITAIRSPWMADTIAGTARDRSLQVDAARATAGLADGSFALVPWQVLARAADRRPLASAAASGDRLIVAALAHEGDVVVPTLLRAITTALAPRRDPGAAEILPIPDSQLRAWTRAPGPAPSPRFDTVERDDRRWMWGAVLLLLLIETWMRRATAAAAPEREESHARVA